MNNTNNSQSRKLAKKRDRKRFTTKSLVIAIILIFLVIGFGLPGVRENLAIKYGKAVLNTDVGTQIAKGFYQMNNLQLEKDFSQTNFSQNPTNANEIAFWLKIVGIKKVLDKTQSDLVSNDDVKICHFIYHTVGQTAYKVYGNAAFEIFDQDCSAGYTHGVIYQYSLSNNSANLISELYNICNNVDSNHYKLECFHGVGHGVLLNQKYNLEHAMNMCKQLPTQPIRNLCYSGAFMENLLAAEGKGATGMSHESHSDMPKSSEWVTSDPFSPCNKLEDDPNIQSVCSVYQAGVILDKNDGDFQKTVKLCESKEMYSKNLCFINIGQEAAYRYKGNPEQIISVCNMSKKYFKSCVDGAIRHFVYFYADELGDRAVNVCKALKTQEKKEFCYN